MTRDKFQDPRIVAAIAAMGLGSVMFDNTAITTAIPSIQEALRTETSSLQWILSAMSITTGTILPFAGAFGDKWGPLRAFRIGIFIFGAGALLGSHAPTFSWLLICRVLQGFGVAFMLPNGGAILNANVDERFRNRAVGLWIGLSSLGLIFGPILGGYLVQNFGWHAVLWGNPCISFFGLALTFLLREGEHIDRIKPIDVRGILSISLGTLLFTAGIIDLGRATPHPPFDIALILMGLALYVFFYRLENRIKHPLVEPSWFSSRRVRGVLIAVFIYNGTIPAATFLVSLLAQKSRHLSPGLGGIVILLMCFLMPAGARVIGKVKNSAGLRSAMLWGAFLLAVGQVTIAVFAKAPLPIFLCSLVFNGLFAGVLFSGDTVAIMESLDREKASSGLAALSMVRQIGAVIGIALFGTLSEIATKLSGSVMSGEMWGIAACGLVTLLAWTTLKDALNPNLIVQSANQHL
jgi:DHA2 family methylenomycin A resistance protein-like MFS transporter